MVCHGPDPPDDSPSNLIPPPRHELMLNGNHEDSDEDQNEYFGYEPLPQGPELVASDRESDEEQDGNEIQPLPNNVPPIEPMENALAREVWRAPRANDPIQMDNDRVQQVMLLMAGFELPEASIPDWAQSITEEQWKLTLLEKIERLRSSR